MFYCGLDISLRKTSICIVDRDGAIVKEATVASDPEAIGQALRDSGRPLERIGIEAGSTSSWLLAGLRAQGWPVVCIDARHAAAALQAGFRNKTDRNDARGIADLMRVNKFRQVWVKSPEAQRQGALLTARSALHRQLVNLENIIRGILRGEGVVLPLGRARFEREVQQATAADECLAGIVAPLLAARAELLRQRAAVDRRIVETARHDPVCRLLATAPGVGAHVALAFRAAIDDPARFRRSRTVGAHLGLTPRQHSSGEVNRTCGISKMGDRHARSMLYIAALCILRRDVGLWCGPKAWALAVAKARGIRKARVALARRLAVVLHRMWVTGEPFRWTQRAGAAA
jgi:transposase